MTERGSDEYMKPTSPRLCANGCGFFGNPATSNLCSKCFREHEAAQQKKAEAQEPMVLEAAAKPLGIPSPESTMPITKKADVCVEENVIVTESVAVQSSDQGGDKDDGAPTPQVHKNRCFSCNKKVGLTGFKCRCGYIFCSVHRYSEKHDCTFDYKSAGRDAIAKANPTVVASKVQKI